MLRKEIADGGHDADLVGTGQRQREVAFQAHDSSRKRIAGMTARIVGADTVGANPTVVVLRREHCRGVLASL
jgi:hypothetical protein